MITNGYRLDVTDLDFIVYRGDDEVFGNPAERAKKMQEAFAKLTGVKKPNFLFKNKGNLQFENVAQSFGLEEPSYTNGTAYADFDNDGDLDLVMNNIDDEAFVYKNTLMDKAKKDQTNNHFLRLKLQGEQLNKNGYGAKVSIFYRGNAQIAEHQTIRGYKSTVEDFIHFGLGNITIIDSLKIIWSSGNQQVIKNISTDKVLTISEHNASPPTSQIPSTPVFTFEEVSNQYGLNWQSEENEYNDFLIQHTLPHKHSELGASIAVGDVNNDGLDDIFIGGSAHKKGVFFF
ncbi:MAG: ASPIC/UnbV domain-containing protein [Arcicella sp.]|nr:ASPIC/UnbV domain-containing protein [Arcicella sp.]